MFKRRKYKIKFIKSYQSTGLGTWREVTDSYILKVLKELQTKFKFEIISTKLRDCFHESKIVIKCDKECKNKIFMDFVNELSERITQVTM